MCRLIFILSVAVIVLSGCTNSSSDKTKSEGRVVDKSAILSTIQDDRDLPVAAPTLHTAPDKVQEIVFASYGGGVAYTVSTGDKICVVHNGKPGSLYNAIGTVVLSQDGSRVAYAAMADGKWYMDVDGTLGEPFSTTKDPKFSPDGRHVAYQAMRGDMWYLVVDGHINSGTKKRYRPHQFTQDSNHIVFIDNYDDSTEMGRLIVSDINFNNERIIDSTVSEMLLSADRTAVAAISKGSAGKERVIQFKVASPENISKSLDYEKVDLLSFDPDSSGMAFVALSQGVKYVVYNGREEILQNSLKPRQLLINNAGKFVGALIYDNKSCYLYQMFSNRGKQGNLYDEVENLVYGKYDSSSAFAARKGERWFIVTNGVEGPGFDRVVSPKFSPSGKYLVYRARKEGKRFVVVADASGRILRQLPQYDQIFDVQFTDDGKSIAYGVKDGKQLAWKVERL
jgi:hypothetical protein